MNQSKNYVPNTVDAVVDDIIADLPLGARGSTAYLNEDEFRVVELTLGKYIIHRLEQEEVQAKREMFES